MSQTIVGNIALGNVARPVSVRKATRATMGPAPAFAGMKAVHKMPKALRAKADANTIFQQASKAAVNAPVSSAKAADGFLQSMKITTKAMNIVFVSAECAPWSKTGGLGDVVGGLPVELAKRGHRVMTIQPRYDQYPDAWDTSVTVNIEGKEVRFFHARKKGVDRVFVDHPLFLAKVWGKTGDKIYGKKSGADFLDNQQRFKLFNIAAIEATRVLPFPYGESATFVANDWHSALVPVLLKHVYKPRGEFVNAKVAMCIHNIAFQGRFWADTWTQLGLPESLKPLFDFEDGYKKVYDESSPAGMTENDKADEIGEMGKKYKKVNWLKAGFLSADKLLTVSPNYAVECSSGKDKGVELDDVIRARGIEGIVNGMDVSEWNPMTDKYLEVKYDEDTVVEGKAAAKAELQAELGLPVDPKAPLICFIGRLEEQKGVDIMLAAIPGIIKANPKAQVGILGTGKKKLEVKVKAMEDLFPDQAKGVVKFSAPLAHLITAGADYILVPSRFEPCGLIQLHAMQYGTVPIVASTGGLVDTVKEGVTGFHMGSMDPDNLVDADVEGVVSTVTRACQVYSQGLYPAMSAKCIGQELSWEKPAKKWEAVLEEMVSGKPGSQSEKKDSVQTPTAQVAA